MKIDGFNIVEFGTRTALKEHCGDMEGAYEFWIFFCEAT